MLYFGGNAISFRINGLVIMVRELIEAKSVTDSEHSCLTLERPTKIYSVVDQPGRVGPLPIFFAKALLYLLYFLYKGCFKCLMLRIYVLKHLG